MTDLDDGTTQSTATRWDYTNDVIAAGYLLAYVVLTAVAAYGYFDLSVLPVYWRTAAVTIALVAVVWTFGATAFRTVMEYRG
jgi:hypothetical protein